VLGTLIQMRSRFWSSGVAVHRSRFAGRSQNVGDAINLAPNSDPSRPSCSLCLCGEWFRAAAKTEKE